MTAPAAPPQAPPLDPKLMTAFNALSRALLAAQAGQQLIGADAKHAARESARVVFLQAKIAFDALGDASEGA